MQCGNTQILLFEFDLKTQILSFEFDLKNDYGTTQTKYSKVRNTYFYFTLLATTATTQPAGIS